MERDAGGKPLHTFPHPAPSLDFPGKSPDIPASIFPLQFETIFEKAV